MESLISVCGDMNIKMQKKKNSLFMRGSTKECLSNSHEEKNVTVHVRHVVALWILMSGPVIQK